MKELVKKKDGLLAEPLIKPERDHTSLYRQARADLDRKMSRTGGKGRKGRRR